MFSKAKLLISADKDGVFLEVEGENDRMDITNDVIKYAAAHIFYRGEAEGLDWNENRVGYRYKASGNRVVTLEVSVSGET